MAQERDDLVYLAKLAEQAERFDEMVDVRRRRRRRDGRAGGLAGRRRLSLSPPSPRLKIYTKPMGDVAAMAYDGGRPGRRLRG